MTNNSSNSLRTTTEEWVDSQGNWVKDPLHSLAVAQLLLLSDAIDRNPDTPSLFAQFGLTMRSLMSERPKDPEGMDELDLLLRGSYESA
jgi:hypothetical protein